jgi:NitT/TauT family transport system substrate-binding protein
MRAMKFASGGHSLAAAAVLLAVSAAPAFAQSKPWRHAIIEPKSDAGFATMVTKGGFAQKHGIQVELPPLQNDAIMLRGLLAGELESFEGGPGTALIAASRGVDVRIIGCSWQTVVHSIFTRGNIATAQDLKGQTFGISAPGATPHLIARAYLAKNNISDSDLKFASLGSDPERYKAMLAGVVAATAISLEFAPLAAKDGFKLASRGAEVAPQFLRLCTMTTARVLAARRDDAVRFLAAEMQAFRYALDNRDEEIRLTREITGAKADDPRPAYIFEEAARPTGVDPTMSIPLDKLDWMQQQLLGLGNMTQAFPSAKVVEEGIRKEALARAGLR